MAKKSVSRGVVHELPEDLRAALLSDSQALALWEDLTPLARNEWICWVEEAKKPETRENRIGRTGTELMEGMRRPCCWQGCWHRKDKKINPSIKYVLSRKSSEMPKDL